METRHSARLKQKITSLGNESKSKSRPTTKPSKSSEPISAEDVLTEKSEISNTRPRRSTAIKKVSYTSKDEAISLEMSSSSSSPDDTDDEMVYMDTIEKKHVKKREFKNSVEMLPSSSGIMKKRLKKNNVTSSSDDTGSSSLDDSDAELRRTAKKTRKTILRVQARKRVTEMKDKGDSNWPKCSRASIARKTGNPSGSGVVKSSLRIATKLKPQQPWKKNLAIYEADRKLAKGERRMKEYRIVAEAYSRGKLIEVSYDDCYKVHEDMKKAYHEGRKIIEAISKKEREQDTGEKQSSSEDEWEEMEHFHPTLDENIEVALEDDEGVEKDWWVVYLRQEVNKKIREMWENTHKVHLLCYMAHLKFLTKTSLDESLVPSLIVSQLPQGYLGYVGDEIPLKVLEKLLLWFTDVFRPLGGLVSTTFKETIGEGQQARFPATRRLVALTELKSFETDVDRSVLLFCMLCGMEATARICVNLRTIPRKWDEQLVEQLTQSSEESENKERSKDNTCSSTNTNKSSCTFSKKKNTKTGKFKNKVTSTEERNYWVEYWNPREKRWICVDPLNKSVDEPLNIHENTAQPMSYVLAIDNKHGITEVTQRYAMDYLKPDFRRRRTDPKWIHTTLCLPGLAADEKKKKLEKMQMHDDLIKRPLPTTLSEYKNHPLYVLEKDLLKFEAIYPPPASQKPLGQIRGHNVYPRATVFTLQGENNWLKLARSVKDGEKAYKVVKARPDPKIPVEDRADQFLNVFGFWQTESYRRPPLENGKIPRNKYGNVYMFNENMCPLDCVHLRLSGLIQISRKLNKQCVPAVVGWAFDGGWTHPVMDGAIVLEKDVTAFEKEWMKLESGKAEREEKKRIERIHENWKKLIKGILRCSHIKNQFNINENLEQNHNFHSKTEQEGVRNLDAVTSHLIIDNSSSFVPLTGFSLDDFVKKKLW